MTSLAWYGLIIYIIKLLGDSLEIIGSNDGNTRLTALIRLTLAAPILIFFYNYLF